jgi:hypothetical protein
LEAGRNITRGYGLKEISMKNKHGFLFGFAVIAMAAIFTFAGCEDDSGDGGGGGGSPTFPAVWVGTDGSIQDWDPTVAAATSKNISFSNTSWGGSALGVYGDTGRSYKLTGAVSGGGTAANGTFKVKRDNNGNLVGDEITVTYEYVATPETLKLTTNTGAVGYEGVWNIDDPFKGGVTYAKAAD